MSNENSINTDTRICPCCGEEIKAIAKKCRFCGEWLNEQAKTVQCPYCAEDISSNDTKCPHCGENLKKKTENSYSRETNKDLPHNLDKFNWGAFLLNWIWGIGNKTWIALWGQLAIGVASCLIYLIIMAIFANQSYTVIETVSGILGVINFFVCIAFDIWLGINGNKWAWENNYWKSQEEFTRIQRNWAMWGCIIVGVLIALILITLLFIAILATATGAGY